MPDRVVRIVVAGQTPPPIGGQNVMIERSLRILEEDGLFAVDHLPFHFMGDWGTSRRISLRKVVELFAVVWRLLKLRLAGRIELLLFPIGGPHVVPTARDMFLLPFCFLLSDRTVLHIHAGGIANALPTFPTLLGWLARHVYRRAHGAVVLTEFSRTDAEVLGIDRIEIVANTLPDTYRPDWDQTDPSHISLLFVGHMGPPKGTPALLEAVAAIRRQFPNLRLSLVGEPLGPYTQRDLSAKISALELDDVVELAGVLRGEEKWRRFGAADLFVFPSVAPESFPLVLLEAMMWGLPVVATDWRAHAEILGVETPGICFVPGGDLSGAVAAALTSALNQRNRWHEWSALSRARYEEYCTPSHEPLVDAVHRFVSQS